MLFGKRQYTKDTANSKKRFGKKCEVMSDKNMKIYNIDDKHTVYVVKNLVMVRDLKKDKVSKSSKSMITHASYAGEYIYIVDGDFLSLSKKEQLALYAWEVSIANDYTIAEFEEELNMPLNNVAAFEIERTDEVRLLYAAVACGSMRAAYNALKKANMLSLNTARHNMRQAVKLAKSANVAEVILEEIWESTEKAMENVAGGITVEPKTAAEATA